jgi:hypothetical protein
MRRAYRWQIRPVFVTSTFRDMQAERDMLRDPLPYDEMPPTSPRSTPAAGPAAA